MATGPESKAQLHPLVLMSISDAITRHVSRSQQTPLVGGLLGQQIRDGVTIEHVFDILLLPSTEGAPWKVDTTFLQKRVRQQQEVHKEPTQLECVGFWTLSDGTESIEKSLRKELPGILPEIVKHVENPLVLAFHADILENQMNGRNLDKDVAPMPFTIYEPIPIEPQAASMETDLGSKPRTIPEAFREIPWEMQTGEAEMIALEFVKMGAGNATRVRTGNTSNVTNESSTASETSKDKAKGKSAATSSTTKRARADLYTPEEEEMLSFLNTRGNAMKTLLARLAVIKKYLTVAKDEPQSVDLEMMRAIKALLSRLPGVEQAKKEQIEESKAEETTGTDPSSQSPGDAPFTDAMLVELLGALGHSIQKTRELGGKFSVVDTSKREGRRRDMVPGGMGMSMDSRFSDVDMMDMT